MSIRYYANAPATSLAASCTSGATTIQVAATTGLPISYPYTIIVDRGLSTEEAMSVTGATGTTLTVTRGIDSTTAFAHGIAAGVVHGITAQDVREPNTHINASTGVHGVSGSLVGTTDAQSLTNKNLTSGSNTFPSTLATLTGVQTLTNKTLTSPIINTPKVDSLRSQVTSSAVVTLSDAASGDGSLTVTANTGTGVTLSPAASAANADVYLTGKGTGKVYSSGAEAVNVSSTQTLSGKTVNLGANTVTGTLAQFNTACSDADLASLAGAEALTNKDLSAGSNTFPAYLNGDSGWTAISMAVGFTGTARIRKIGKLVTLQIDGAYTTATGTNYVITASAVAAGFRPSVAARGGAFFTGYPGAVSMLTDGTIETIQQSGATRSAIGISLTYMVD